MTENLTEARPIGYWLRRADELITLRSNEALQELGLQRQSWQVLHSIHQAGRMNKAQLLLALKDFVDEARLDALLADLKSRGWVAYEVDRGGARLGLTHTGEQAHVEAEARQNHVRARLAQGISEAQYQQLIATLQKVVENLQ